MTTSSPDPFESWWPPDDEEIRNVFTQMLADGSWGRYHGPHCKALIAALADYHQVEHVILCSSGTAAVELALRATGVTRNDEVILAAYDYKANFSNIVNLQAIPVLVDTGADRPVINVAAAKSAITNNTKAIVASHLHGNLAPIDELRRVTSEAGIALIEDACQTPGASIGGGTVGSLGDVGTLSFGGSKLLTAGRGGAVLTNDSSIAQRIRLHVQRGNDAYPLSEMQAAILLPQLNALDERNRARAAAVQRLATATSESTVLKPAWETALTETSAFYKVPFLLKEAAEERDDFCRSMRSQMVPLSAGFPGLHLIHAKRRFRAATELPHATQLHERLVTLHHPVLLREHELNTCCQLLADCGNEFTYR